MKSVAITHGDIMTPLGDLSATWGALLAGKRARLSHPFSQGRDGAPVAMIEDLGKITDNWQRHQNLFSRLFENLPQLDPDTFLVCATTKGAVDELLEGSVSGQPWQLAEYLAEYLQLTGGTSTVSAACASGSLGIIQAAMRILGGECSKVLVVGVDLLSQFVYSGFAGLKALSMKGAAPFDMERDGLTLGDGAGWVLLSLLEDSLQETAPPALIDSFAITCDATHVTAPCRYASGLIRALKDIKSKSSLPVGGVNGHGTGTRYNDAMEILAFDTVYATDIPVYSVKGAIGHSLGAAGLIETLLSVKSLECGVLPATVGLKHAEKTLCGLSGSQSQKLVAPSVITCNSGFGGINSVILLKNGI